MWLLLVAVGAGYLARCWQNSHRSQPQAKDDCVDSKRSLLTFSSQECAPPSTTCCSEWSEATGKKLPYSAGGFNAYQENDLLVYRSENAAPILGQGCFVPGGQYIGFIHEGGSDKTKQALWNKLTKLDRISNPIHTEIDPLNTPRLGKNSSVFNGNALSITKDPVIGIDTAALNSKTEAQFITLVSEDLQSSSDTRDCCGYAHQYAREEQSLSCKSTDPVCSHRSEGQLLSGFGLGIAFLFMLSSSQNEREKMKRLLKETEELVSDMKKELGKRKAQTILASETVAGSETFSTYKAKSSACELETEKTRGFPEFSHKDNFNGDDDSAESVLTEEHVQDNFHISDLEAAFEAELELIKFGGHQKIVRDQQKGHSREFQEKEEDHSSSRSGNEKHVYPDDISDDKSLSVHKELDVCSYSLPPIEVERRLWQVLQQRQEEEIAKLERRLEFMEHKVHSNEEELHWWRERVKLLTELPTSEQSMRTQVAEGCEGFLNSNKDCEAHFYPTYSSENEMNPSIQVSEGCSTKQSCDTQCFALKSMTRTGSVCSFSSEGSVISFDVTGFVYPGYDECVETAKCNKSDSNTNGYCWRPGM